MAGILDGKITLITGAASGIGRATAKIFAREGARLVLADIMEAGGQETVQMVKGRGAIVNTSSIMGLTGAIRVPAYTAAKHGVVGITKAAALEYARHGIRINAVCPAPIYTPMLTKALEKRPDIEERYARAEPMKRIGQPEEVGEAVAWLCSDRASLLIGLQMSVDGGYITQ